MLREAYLLFLDVLSIPQSEQRRRSCHSDFTDDHSGGQYHWSAILAPPKWAPVSAQYICRQRVLMTSLRPFLGFADGSRSPDGLPS
jgi:hypothetical protein